VWVLFSCPKDSGCVRTCALADHSALPALFTCGAAPWARKSGPAFHAPRRACGSPVPKAAPRVWYLGTQSRAAPDARCPGVQSRAAPVARCPGVQSRAVRTVPSAPVPKTYRAYGPRTDKPCAGRQILLQFRDCGVYMKKLFHSTPFLRNIYPLWPVSMRKQGIYRKILCPYPVYRKKVDTKVHFFPIYPAARERVCLNLCKRPCTGYRGEIFSIYPGRPRIKVFHICQSGWRHYQIPVRMASFPLSVHPRICGIFRQMQVTYSTMRHQLTQIPTDRDMRFEESKYQKRGIGQARGQGIYVKQQAIPKPAFWKQRLDNIGRLPPQEANLQGKFAFKPGLHILSILVPYGQGFPIGYPRKNIRMAF